MFCVKCGSNLKEGSLFCHNCGKKIKDRDEYGLEKKVKEHILSNDDVGGNHFKDNNNSLTDFQDKPINNMNNRKLIIGITLMVLIFSMFLFKNIIIDGTGDNISKIVDIPKILNEDSSEVEIAETEEIKLLNLIENLNKTSYSMQGINVHEENFKPGIRGYDYKWDPNLFYTLEDISPSSDLDGLINSYIIEKKQLINLITDNLMEYEIYRNPDTNVVNKIVSIEYKGQFLEITEYYYTDEGKINFIFVRNDVNYVPSYATQDKSGARFYYNNDVMVKWRVVENLIQKNHIIGHQEKERGGNSGTITLYEDLTEIVQRQYDEMEIKMLNAAYNTYNIVLNSTGISRIVGYVLDQDGKPIKDVDMDLFANDFEKKLYTCKTDAEGKYSILIPSEERIYRIEVSKNGYSYVNLYNINQNKQLIGIYQENIFLVSNNIDSEMDTEIIIRDAFNKAYDSTDMIRLDYASINIREGINNKSGPIYKSSTSDIDGISNLKIRPGMYTVEVEKSGYEVAYYNISVIKNYMTININSTPVLNEGEVRIVLTWNDTPFDLDSHLFTPYDSSSGDSTYHIWFGNKYDYNGNNLDVDDVNGYGPETMTINRLGNGQYKFYVVDYSNCIIGNTNSTDMSNSNAVVSIYSSEGLVNTFNVPTNRPGVVWEVFEIRDKKIIPLQRYYNNLDNNTWWNNDK